MQHERRSRRRRRRRSRRRAFLFCSERMRRKTARTPRFSPFVLVSYCQKAAFFSSCSFLPRCRPYLTCGTKYRLTNN